MPLSPPGHAPRQTQTQTSQMTGCEGDDEVRGFGFGNVVFTWIRFEAMDLSIYLLCRSATSDWNIHCLDDAASCRRPGQDCRPRTGPVRAVGGSTAGRQILGSGRLPWYPTPDPVSVSRGGTLRSQSRRGESVDGTTSNPAGCAVCVRAYPKCTFTPGFHDRLKIGDSQDVGFSFGGNRMEYISGSHDSTPSPEQPWYMYESRLFGPCEATPGLNAIQNAAICRRVYFYWEVPKLRQSLSERRLRR